MRIASGIAALALACAGIGACQAIVGIRERHLLDEAGMMQPDANDPCTADPLRPRPDISTSSPTDAIDFVAALSEVSLGLSSDAGPASDYGFNLDRACSCPPDPPSTCLAPDADNNLCDYENGIDLGGRKIFAIAKAAGLIQESELNAGLVQGAWGAMIRVQDWNGRPDDEQVRVSIYSSLGIQGDGGVKGDGTDRWLVETTSIKNGNVDQPLVQDATAYVAKGTLYSRLLSFPLTIGSRKRPAVFMNLTAAVLAAEIQVTDGGPRILSGILAGRWAAAEALPALQVFKDQQGGYLCGDSGQYQLIKNFLCQNVDINHYPLSAPTDPCDSSSIGLRFKATQATFGAVLSPPDSGGGCGPNWSDSCQ